jgi:REP-associated tyrosine transposase
MLIAYHVIMSAYGFWLPNDPRGSWSDTIRKLLCFGPATKVRNNEFVAHVPHNRRLREAAKEVLDYPPVSFTDEQIGVIGKGFAQFVEKSGVTFWAVSILDDHVHAIYMRHRYKSEMVNNLLKGELTKSLVEWDVHPFRSHVRSGERPPPCWGRKWWTVYIDNLDHLQQAIPYVEDNPLKDGRPRQKWDFVVPYPLTLAEWKARKGQTLV